jgi:hypothetical protein
MSTNLSSLLLNLTATAIIAAVVYILSFLYPAMSAELRAMVSCLTAIAGVLGWHYLIRRRFVIRGLRWVGRQISRVYLRILWHLVVRPAKDHLSLMTTPQQPTDLWRYDFYDNFIDGQQQRHAGSDIELHPEAVCNGKRKRAIFEHPPDDYKRSTIVTYPVAPPPGTSLLLLTGFVGIETFRPTPNGDQRSGRSSDNHVKFQITIDNQVKFKQRKRVSDWERFSILFVADGGNVSVRFGTNNLGENAYNWAVWGEPELIEVLRLA